MQRSPSPPPQPLVAVIRAGRLLACTLGLLLAACGGGGDPAPAAPTATDVAAGQRAQAAIGAAGGSVVLSTREGASFTLTVPPGAVPEGTVLALETATPAAGRRLHLRLAPAGLVPASPLVLTLALPPTLALPAGAALVYDRVPLRTSVLADGRIELRLPALAGNAPAAGAGEPRARALSARSLTTRAPSACGGVPALDPTPDGGLADSAPITADDYGSCMLGAVNALALSGQFAEAVRLASSLGAYLQSIGAANTDGLSTRFITEARTLACTAYGQALDAAAGTTVTSFAALSRAVKPVLFWEAAVQQLGALCADIAPTRYVSVVENLTTEALRFFASRKGAVVDVGSVEYTEAVAEARAGPAAVAELRSVQAPAPVQALARAQVQERAQPAIVDAVLQAPWQRCRDSGNFDTLIELMQLAQSPPGVKHAAQYCATQLQAQARNGTAAVTATLAPSLGGISAGNQRTSGSIEVATDGTLTLEGPIRALPCPAGSVGGSESLQVKLGSTVLHTLTAAPYLSTALQIDIAAALRSAGINASGFSGATLTLSRSGSPCGGFWGDAPEPLLALNLTSGTCAPPAGYTFCASALSVPVDATQEPLLNDRGDLLVRSTQPESYAFAARGASAATPLPAGLGAPWRQVSFNARGDFLAGQAADYRLMAIWPAGSPAVVPLPMPALPAGFPLDTYRIVSHAVLGDDGAVIGAVQFSGLVAPGSVPAGCMALQACVYNYVVRWAPPYNGAPRVLDGPLVKVNDASPIEITAINAAGVAVGLRPTPGSSSRPYSLVRWSNAGIEVLATVEDANRHVHIDDRGTIVHFQFDTGGLSLGLVSTGPLAGVPDPNRLLEINAAGFAVACNGTSKQLVDTRDGRSWSLDPASLVDPASGWSVDTTVLTRVGCDLAGQVFGPLPMNRLGHWVVRGSRLGNGSWLVLTPRGQPLP
jgi:hypothetical protein